MVKSTSYCRKKINNYPEQNEYITSMSTEHVSSRARKDIMSGPGPHLRSSPQELDVYGRPDLHPAFFPPGWGVDSHYLVITYRQRDSI